VSDLEADVVVIGGGGAGLAAAIEARSVGRSVLLLEKNAKLGGSTAWSVGSISASNTSYQIRRGILDSPDDHFEDMGLFCAKLGLPDNVALRRVLVDNVPDTFRWLQSMGIVFHGPLLQPPHRRPRMHNVLPNSRAYIYHLARRARRLGVRILTESRAKELLTQGRAVVGVRIDTPRGETVVQARGGVVLATGDFGGSAAMRETYIGKAIAAARPINPTNTGDGHVMAQALGGRIVNAQHHLAGVRFVPPPPSWQQSIPPYPLVTRFIGWSLDHMPAALLRPFVMGFVTTVLQSQPGLYQQGAVLVNRAGNRFNDELGNPTAHLAEQPEGEAFILLDGRLRRLFSGPPHHISTAPGIAYAYIDDYRRSRRDIYREAPSLERLARALRMPVESLERTIAQYNTGEVPSGAASPRGSRPALGEGPYVALGPVRHYITFSDSGVAANERHQVLDARDEPIEGLYAAGFVGMGGMLLEGLGHHLGWAFTSGRRAGRHAAMRVRSGGAS
jgi:succinate dehydrogenase/fumarate reductase flavoprotein subunit